LLTGDGCDQIEVGVVVQHCDIELLGCRGYQQVRDLASPLASSGEQSLDLESATDLPCSGFDSSERVERSDKLIPLIGVTSGVADLEVAHSSATETSAHGQRFDD
jgi:hypothetical protein